jgi:hypothetical protein
MAGKDRQPHLLTPEQIEIFSLLPPWTAFVDPGPTCGVATVRQPPAPERGDLYDRHFVVVTQDEERAKTDFGRFCLEAKRRGRTPTLVIEEYRIYPESIAVHYGKTVPTAECIGAFKYVVTRLGGVWIEHASQVKQPTAGMLKARGIKLIGGSEHAKDAQLHMWHHVLRKQHESRRIG